MLHKLGGCRGDGENIRAGLRLLLGQELLRLELLDVVAQCHHIPNPHPPRGVFKIPEQLKQRRRAACSEGSHYESPVGIVPGSASGGHGNWGPAFSVEEAEALDDETIFISEPGWGAGNQVLRQIVRISTLHVRTISSEVTREIWVVGPGHLPLGASPSALGRAVD